MDGQYRQVSRLGMPLVNEVVIPLKDKNRFNASAPRNDGQFLDYVTKPELPKLIEAVYGVDAPDEPRNDLVSVFLTGVAGLNQPAGVTPSEQLRLNMTTPVTGDPDSARRHRRRQPGLPERTPPGRRRPRHRAAGRRGRARRQPERPR